MASDHGNSAEAIVTGVVKTGVRRRAVLHAGWTVPAVLAVTAAPALAVSQPIQITSVAGSCRLPGNSCDPAPPKGYRMVLTITANQAGTLHVDHFEIDAKKPTTGLSQETFTLAAGSQTVTFLVYSEASAKGSAEITCTFTPRGGSPGTFPTSIAFPNFPVCDNC